MRAKHDNEIPDSSWTEQWDYLIHHAERSKNRIVQKVRKREFALLFFLVIGLLVVNTIAVIIGTSTAWYKKLTKVDFRNPASVLFWILATVSTYFGLYLLWKETYLEDMPLDFFITGLYIFGALLSLIWICIFYFMKEITGALVFSGVILLYRIGLFVYVFTLSKIAAIFLIPIIIMYTYQLAATAYIRSEN